VHKKPHRPHLTKLLRGKKPRNQGWRTHPILSRQSQASREQEETM
jgi:hypothetical protein